MSQEEPQTQDDAVFLEFANVRFTCEILNSTAHNYVYYSRHVDRIINQDSSHNQKNWSATLVSPIFSF